MAISSIRTGETGISLALDNNYMEPIATTLVGSGGVNQVTFNDIPQSYKHLQIRYIARGVAAPDDGICLSFNGQWFSTMHRIRGNGTTALADGATGGTFDYNHGIIPGGTATANVYAGGIIDIVDYTNISKAKTFRHLGGMDTNGGGFVNFVSGLWNYTDSVVSITIGVKDGGTGKFAQYSRFSLYGIKG